MKLYNDINYKEKEVLYNIPEIIEYKEKQFKIGNKNSYDKKEVTWNCQ